MKQLPVIQPQAEASTASPSGTATRDMVSDPAHLEALRPAIVEAIKTIFDPEIPVNIWELGLIYDIFVNSAQVVGVRMTLTAPNCPAAQWLPGQVEQKIRVIDGVTDVKVDVVFDPPWDRERMSDAAKLQLGMW